MAQNDFVCTIPVIMKPHVVATKPFLSRLLDSRTPVTLTTQGRTVFTDAWSLGPRVIADSLVYHIERGTLSVTIEGEQFLLSPGMTGWFLPGAMQEFILTARHAPATIYFFRFLLGGETRPYRIRENYVLSDDASVKAAFIEILKRNNIDGNYRDAFIRANIAHVLTKTLSGGGGMTDAFTRIERDRILGFIGENITRRFRIDEVAGELSLTTDYFSRKFKRTFRYTPQAWIKRERIERACSLLLEVGMNVTEVARALGYDDIYLFSKQFKHVMGVSPSRWQRSDERDE